MSKNIKISIITVCYNAVKTIEETIKSILKQDYDNLEYIIIDGSSTDQTVSVVNRYKNKFDNIQIISEKDTGIYNAMNKGIKISSGEIIGILNADDQYKEGAINEVVNSYIKNNDVDIFYGFIDYIKNGKIIKNFITPHLSLRETTIQHPACFVKKETYAKYGVFNEKYKIAADYEFFLRTFLSGGNFMAIEKTLTVFSLGGVSNREVSITKLENLKIKYSYNLISKRKFYTRSCKYLLKRAIEKIRMFLRK